MKTRRQINKKGRRGACKRMKLPTTYKNKENKQGRNLFD
jgi:hypothetical protein